MKLTDMWELNPKINIVSFTENIRLSHWYYVPLIWWICNLWTFHTSFKCKTFNVHKSPIGACTLSLLPWGERRNNGPVETPPCPAWQGQWSWTSHVILWTEQLFHLFKYDGSAAPGWTAMLANFNNQFSRRPKPWFVAFADFCGVNTPSMTSFKLSTEVSEHGVWRDKNIWLGLPWWRSG